MDPAQAEPEKHKVRLCPQDVALGAGLFAQLPPLLQDLTDPPLRLQARIIYLDRSIRMPAEAMPVTPIGVISELDRQREQIRQAFGGR